MDKETVKKYSRLMTGKDFWNSATDPSVRFSDGPTGVRAQEGSGDNLGLKGAKEATCFPTHSALACSWNTELIKSVGSCIGNEAAERGVDVLLAPGLNIKRNPLCGRNFEYFSEDPYLAGKLGAAYSSGVKSQGVGTCLKHFAANNREYGRMVYDSVVDERTLRELYLTAFEIAVKDSRPSAVMTAYNKLNGKYCSENPHLIRDILRGEWGFDGIVISDWGGTHDRAAGIAAGSDLEMPRCAFTPEEVENAVFEGRLEESALTECAERLTNFSRRQKKIVNGRAYSSVYAVKSAAESAVLLKNDGTLPLKKGEKVALIGEFAQKPLIQGGGSSNVNTAYAENLADCLKSDICGFERGYRADGKASKKLRDRALKLCGEAEVIVFCAGYAQGDCEGADRNHIRLPSVQTELLEEIYRLKKRVAIVLYCGSAVETQWDHGAFALLYAGLAGQGGARAVADLLYGKCCPSGKLAESFPVSLSDLPSTAYFNKDPYYTLYGEGMAVGYRGLEAIGVKYPFGHGLSYTEFTYSDLKITHNGVEFCLENTGGHSGGEVVQFYIQFPDSANARGLQLKGFKKIFLTPNELIKVRINFDEYTFRSWDSKNKRWARVSGVYVLNIGASSADIRLSGKIKIIGDAKSVPAPDTGSLTPPAPYPVKVNAKGRVVAEASTPFCELKNAQGAFGRLLCRIALRAVRKNPTVSGTLEYLPLRTLAQFGKFSKCRFDGFLDMLNGKFFKGLWLFLINRKSKRRDKKCQNG